MTEPGDFADLINALIAERDALQAQVTALQELVSAGGDLTFWMTVADGVSHDPRCTDDSPCLRCRLAAVTAERDALREKLSTFLDGTVSNAVHDRHLAIEEGWRQQAEARAHAAEQQLAEVREDLVEEQGQRSRAINAEACALNLRQALEEVKAKLCRCVPDSYSQPCVDEDAAICDAIIDRALVPASGVVFAVDTPRPVDVVKALMDENHDLQRTLEAQQQQLAEVRGALEELTAVVRGECPSLLDEDSGGDAELEMRIAAILALPASPPRRTEEE